MRSPRRKIRSPSKGKRLRSESARRHAPERTKMQSYYHNRSRSVQRSRLLSREDRRSPPARNSYHSPEPRRVRSRSRRDCRQRAPTPVRGARRSASRRRSHEYREPFRPVRSPSERPFAPLAPPRGFRSSQESISEVTMHRRAVSAVETKPARSRSAEISEVSESPIRTPVEARAAEMSLSDNAKKFFKRKIAPTGPSLSEMIVDKCLRLVAPLGGSCFIGKVASELGIPAHALTRSFYIQGPLLVLTNKQLTRGTQLSREKRRGR